MDALGAGPLDAYDGVPTAGVRDRLGVPALHAYAAVASTMDLAHAAAARGAPAGTTVVADAQTAGRGRAGRSWASEPGAGVWATVVVRPVDVAAVGVLSLRVGLALAEGLERLAPVRIVLKWPNDLLVGGRKLAGILVEARWREGVPEWVAVGVGINRVAPDTVTTAVGLGASVARADILAALVAAVQGAATRTGVLSDAELAAFARRDAVRGRRATAPVAGVVAGVSPTGALLVQVADGPVREVPTASVQYADDWA